MYLTVDYIMKLVYVRHAHSARSSSHPMDHAVFVLFRPVIAGRPGRPDGGRGTPVSCFHPVAYPEVVGAGLCPVTCFSPVIYRERRLDCALAATASAAGGRPSYSSSSRNGSAS